MPEMPALPEPFDTMAALQGASIDSTLRCEIVEVPVYTAEQMQAYAAAAVAAEREACAAEALKHTTHPDDPSNEVWQCAYNHVATEIAAAIRERK